MPRKKDYSTMTGEQLGRAVVLDNIAQWLKASDDEHLKEMSRYILTPDEWGTIYMRLGDLSEAGAKDDVIEVNRYNDLKKYMYKTFTVNELLIYYAVTSNTKPLKAALHTACAQESIQLRIPKQSDDVTALFHLHDGNYFIYNSEDVITAIAEIKEGLGTLYAMTAFTTIVGEKFKIPQLKYYLLPLDDVESDVDEINNGLETLKDIIGMVADNNEGEEKERAERVIAALNKIPLPIVLEDLQPSETDKKQAKKDITRDVFSGGTPNETNIIATLDRGGRNWGV